jgi:hypothetical protein
VKAAAFGSHGQALASEVEFDDRAAGAVADAETRIVPPAEDAISDTEVAVAKRKRDVAEAAVAEHEHARRVVEFADVVTSMGEHDRPVEVAARPLPPVLEQAPLRERRVVDDLQPSSCGRVREVRLRVTVAEARERDLLAEVVLAAVLRQVGRAEPLAERRVEAAGANGGELLRVADQDRLAVRVVGQAEERLEHAGVGHPGFVDNENAVLRQAAFAPRVEQEAVHRRAANRGRGLELVGGAAARGGAEDGDAGVGEDVVHHAQRGCLAGACHADDAHDPVRAHRRLAHEPPLLLREIQSLLRKHAAGGGAWSVDVATGERELERLALDRQQLLAREQLHEPPVVELADRAGADHGAVAQHR